MLCKSNGKILSILTGLHKQELECSNTEVDLRVLSEQNHRKAILVLYTAFYLLISTLEAEYQDFN
jgi:hypothetical protein